MVLMAGVAATYAAIPASEVFAKIPPAVLEILLPAERLDMIDYWKADSIYKATNEMGGLSWIETMTDNYARIHITDVSSLEIKVLPEKKNAPAAVAAYTISQEGIPADSRVFFLSSDMTLLPTEKYFPTPRVRDFFLVPKGCKTSYKELEQMVEYPTVEYTLSPDADTLAGRLTIGEYMTTEDYNLLKMFVRPKVVWSWDGSKFKLAK